MHEASSDNGPPTMPSRAEAAAQRFRKWRKSKDVGTSVVVRIAGFGVVASLALIFVFLFAEVGALLKRAEIGEPATYASPGGEQGLFIASERYQQVAVRFAADGSVTFYEPQSGAEVLSEQVDFGGAQVSSFASAEPRTGVVAYGMNDGRAIVAEHSYQITYPDDERTVVPELLYPLATPAIAIDDNEQALEVLAVQEGNTGYAVAAWTADDRLLLTRFEQTRHFLTGASEITRKQYTLPAPPGEPTRLLLDITFQHLLVGDGEGNLHYYDISNPAQARLRDSASVISGNGASVTAMQYLLGTVSIIVGGSDGSVTQFFLVRDENNVNRIQRIRDFEQHPAAITAIFPEFNRKGFLVGDAAGHIGLHFATSSSTLFLEQVADQAIQQVSIAPRNDAVYYATNDAVRYADLWNEHPESSWSSLWGKVWYEGRDEPDYVWQSSSATDEFEPKLSMIPLTIGTLKAAFYAMLFAMPIAVFGAIYTAYFMSPRMRGMVKPTIEVMEALPTVILGFLAGLWMAPFAERNLPAVFSVVFLMPLAMLLAAGVWRKLPEAIRHRVPTGWEAAILIPVVLFTGWACVTASPLIEVWLFDGNMRQWLTDVGITYDQRNAMVVGIAMGFAVIPAIFSIAEDAVFNVPKHLTQGSLALGATPWQTVIGVVILTASPGIFSAVMIGFGRAVGETMIVLMATGNSPVTNFNIFEGMRTLSANIAVEMPEAAVGSTHYRLLFMAALVLFGFTFILNTIAELVRQRLRTKYSSL
jgi:phosphate transport system permease protein